MNLLIAPVRSLFDIGFYKKVSRASLGLGLAYAFYLSVITAAAALLLYSVIARPHAETFLNWAEKAMPPLAYTSQGFIMSAKSPYVMKHENYGTVAVFDMDHDAPQPDMGDPIFYVTPKRVFMEMPDGGRRAFNVDHPDVQNNRAVIVNEIFKKVRTGLMPVMGVLIFIGAMTFSFVYQTIAAVLFSILGILFNLLRKNRLPYSAVLSLTYFCLTVMWIVGLCEMLLNAVKAHPHFSAGVYVLPVVLYLFLAVKVTEENSR